MQAFFDNIAKFYKSCADADVRSLYRILTAAVGKITSFTAHFIIYNKNRQKRGCNLLPNCL